MPLKQSQGYGLPLDDLDSIVEHVGPLWESLRCARIFVTGGTGFFGHWLLASLAHANRNRRLKASALVLSRNPSAFAKRAPYLCSESEIALWKGDVRDFEFPGGEFSHLIHCATDTTQMGATHPFELIDTIANGTRRVVDFANASGVSRLLYVSSGAIYGPQPSDLPAIPENYVGAPDPLALNASYGEAKRLAEHICRLHAARVPCTVVIARGFAFVGPLLPLERHFAIGNFIRDALAGNEIVVKGDGTPLRSYLYSADLAAWSWVMLLKGESGRAYNLGSDAAVDIGSLADIVARTVAPGVRIKISNSEKSEGFRNRYVPAIGRARSELGLDVWIPLELAIHKTAAWHQIQQTAEE